MRQALEGLRDEGILSIVEERYVYSFDEALKSATTAEPEERRAAMSDLMKRSDARQAHPTLDYYILPIYFNAGAAGLDIGKRL
ncbi:hypothetical protein F5Y09DRAFT_348356 [Xylaria sp. FL1042]|nr:hypothetical protein F5Y09DRAFT_348356 [Xylaria sp. FL1042]